MCECVILTTCLEKKNDFTIKEEIFLLLSDGVKIMYNYIKSGNFIIMKKLQLILKKTFFLTTGNVGWSDVAALHNYLKIKFKYLG